MADFVKTISEQGYSCFDIDNNSLAGVENTCRFNGSIVDYNGKTLMAYRAYDPDTKNMNVFISELDEKYNVISNHKIGITKFMTVGIFEDPRLFVHRGELWMVFIELDFSFAPRTMVRCTKLNDKYQYCGGFSTRFGKNGVHVEKNWIYLSHNNSMYMCYDLQNQKWLKIDESGQSTDISEEKSIVWDLGHLRCGTQFIKHTDSTYISAYHGCTEHAWIHRRYYMGFVEVENKWPFRIVRLTNPMIIGSNDERWCGSGNGQCVFPAGIVDRGDEYHVSAGINDTFNKIIVFNKDKIESKLKPVSHFMESHAKCYIVDNPRQVQTMCCMENLGRLIKVSGTEGRRYMIKTADPFAIKSIEALGGSLKSISLEEHKEISSKLDNRVFTYIEKLDPIYTKKRGRPRSIKNVDSD